MSRASKVFLSSAITLTAATVWYVHYIQTRESDVSALDTIHPSHRYALFWSTYSTVDSDIAYRPCTKVS